MMTSGRRSFEDGSRLWDKGGIQPKPPKREARAGYWLTDGQALYPHLRQEARATAKIAVKPEPKLARGKLGPATQLVALYADGSDDAVVAAGKLTLEMIAETATWFDGKGDPRAPEAAEKVRAWWLNQVRIADGEDAEELEERWAIAFAKAKGAKPEPEVAKPTKTYAEIKAEIAAKRAKAATAISEASAKADAELAAEVAKPTVITKPVLSPLLPGFEKFPEAPKPPPGATELERLTYPPGLLGHDASKSRFTFLLSFAPRRTKSRE
jgi:hypothetical protein